VDITTVGVLGCGTMGSGIAIVCANAGLRAVVREVDEERVRAGLAAIEAFYAEGVRRGQTTEDEARARRERISGTTDLAAFRECQVVVEAVFEDLAAKRQAMADLDGACAPTALFATNTSTLSVSGIAGGSRRPERVVGMHFFFPPPLNPIVEVTRALQTSDEAHGRALAFGRKLGKTLVETRDTPGFIANRFLVPFHNDCIRALEAGLGRPEDIDTVIRLGFGYPMGPFALMDAYGLDIHLQISRILHEAFADSRFAAPPLVQRMVEAGWLGRKTGRGFYPYPPGPSGSESPPPSSDPRPPASSPRLGVLGCGAMGSGIAIVGALAGSDVVILEASAELAARGTDRIEQFLADGVRRGKASAEAMAAVRGRIRATVERTDLADREVIIEAVSENVEVKRHLWRDVCRAAPRAALLASNTSCLSITELAAATDRPAQFVGLHFFNPPPLMRLVEVVRGLDTSAATLAQAVDLVRALGKVPVVTRDSPGFISNRLYAAVVHQVVQALDDGLAPRDEIETVVRLGLGQPMGPYTLLDLVGLDVAQDVCAAMYEALRDPHVAPPPLLRRMVQAGRLGRKTGRGFFDYPAPSGR
jgi:3-hydroxybutyryl-CoA dehydrogenase